MNDLAVARAELVAAEETLAAAQRRHADAVADADRAWVAVYEAWSARARVREVVAFHEGTASERAGP